MTPDAVNDWKRKFSFRQVFGKSFVLLQLQHKTAKIHFLHCNLYRYIRNHFSEVLKLVSPVAI